MSEITGITIEAEGQTGTAMAVIKAGLPTILAADDNNILGKLAEKIAAFIPDVSTATGRKAIASLAAQVATAKMDLVRLANSLTEADKKRIALVLAERKIIEEKMDELKRRVRAPLDEIEAAEAAIEQANKNALAAMQALLEGLDTLTPAEIIDRHAQLRDFDWSIEFRALGEQTKRSVVAQLRVAHADAKNAAIAAAEEVARIEAEAKAQRLADIEAQRAREEQIARDAAAEATRRAEIEASQKANEAERAARDAREAVERKAEADRRAIEAKAIAETQEAERQARESREIAARAQQAAKDAADREEAARVMAEARARQAAADAEKKLAEQLAAERKRVADERAAEEAATAKRAANIEHKRKINGAVVVDLIVVGLTSDQAIAVVKAIATGKVSHVSIGY